MASDQMAGIIKTWGKIKQNWLVVVIFVLTMLVANWTLLTERMFYTHDYLHGARIAEFARGLTEGQMPVIWSQNFGFGYGMPLFEFYAPLPYLVGAIFYLLGFNLIGATKILIFLSSLLSFLGAYRWGREFFQPKVAALSGAFLTLAAYRATDIFARGALSEVWAIAALPWLFLGLTRICKGTKNGWWYTVLGAVTLILSHNITTMLVAPLALGYVILLAVLRKPTAGPRDFNTRCHLAHRQVTRVDSRSQANAPESHCHCSPHIISQNDQFVKRGKTLISAGLTTLGLTAFYLLPAFFEKNLTQVDTWILGDYFNFRLHFLYLRQFWTDNFGYGGSGWGPNDGLSFFLGWAQWLALLLSVVLMGGWAVKMCQRKKLRVIKNEVIFFGGMLILLGLTLFLSTMKAQMIWETFAGLLAFAQFPWRYVGIAIVILAVLAPYGLKLLPEKWQTGLTVALVTVLLVTSARYYRGERDLDEPAFYQGEAEFIAEEMSPTLVDYLPLTFANEWQAREPTTYVLGTEKQPEVLVDRMHEKLYRFREQKTATVELAIANYPGWTAEINGSEAAIQTSERGNIEVVVPSGEFDLGVKLRPTVLRFWSNLVSVVTVMGVISYGIGEQCRKKQ